MGWIAAGLSLLAAAFFSGGAPRAAITASSELQTARNLGKAYYEQGRYTEAVSEFEKVMASGRAVALDHLDLGQALIQANRLDAAFGELNTAKQMSPNNPAIEYNLGILYKRELRYPLAEAELRRVLAADPNDPATWFNLGDVYFAEQKLAPSLDAFKRVVGMGYARAQNFYVAATFHCFTILSRQRQPQQARKYLKLNMSTRNKVPNVSLRITALEAGKYGVVKIAPAPLTSVAARLPQQLVFKDITPNLTIDYEHDLNRGTPGAERTPRGWAEAVSDALSVLPLRIAVGDYNSDGLPDIYLLESGSGHANHLLRNDGSGAFSDVTAHAGLEGPEDSIAAQFVDYDNSGRPSLVVAGAGGVKVYKNNGDRTFTDVTHRAGFQNNPCEMDSDVKAVDLDNDGFLDLVVTEYMGLCGRILRPPYAAPISYPPGRVHLYHNNGDGTFTDITASAGLSSVQGYVRQVVFGDFDNDGYIDLLFLRDLAPPIMFINKGSDRFADRTAQAGSALAHSEANEAAVGDFNHDGKLDVALWGPRVYSVLLNRGNARFEKMAGLPSIHSYGSIPGQLGAIADLNGDGFEDLLVKAEHGVWRAVLNKAGQGFEEVPLKFSPHWPMPGFPGGNIAAERKGWFEGSIWPAWLIRPADLDLLTYDYAGPTVFQRQGPTPRWINIKLEGYKSNKQGIGDIIELKAGNYYDKVLVQHGGSVRIFTGDLPKLDVVRVTWPNQVVQNAINVATDTTITMRESERLASSCPFLYVWNGKRYVFYTDVLGDAPIGELAPDGSYLRPNPEDLVRLGSNFKPAGGQYVFQLTDEMREVDYFDQVRLLAVDHPATEDVYSNEIYSPTPLAPALYAIGKKRFPVSAVNDRGENVLPLLLHADGKYPSDFRRRRILGLAQTHSLTLDLGRFPQKSQVALWLRGWVLWTDSNASRALMSNHRLKMTDPYLQVRDKAGRWVTVIPDIGLPSGTRRTMRVDLTGKLLTADHHIRIVTNLCVYWDQIFFTTDERSAAPSFSLPVASADLHYRGFSQVASDPRHRQPDDFDYVRLMTRAPWNPAGGPFTRYGAVARLLNAADDQLVVMSPGDEMTVKFGARGLPRLRPGWKRDFFLYIRGYAKDGEPNTAFARSAEPLPFRAMRNYPPAPGGARPHDAAYERYLRKYETRPAHVLIPPLAPAR